MSGENEMKLEFDSRSCNEGFARVAVAAFMTQLNPTLEEVADVKTALSEAVTNAVIHGYEGAVKKITVECRISGQTLFVEVKDGEKELRTWPGPWNPCLPPGRTVIGPAWDFHSWRLLWIRWRWIRRPAGEPGSE